MPYEQRPNSGSMFLVEQKKKDSFPDFEGSVEVNGEQMWVSGWKKTGNGKKFISLSFKPKDPSKRPGAEPTSTGDGW